MTTVTVYRSTDASAPTLSGTAGTLVTVLDACLVNGYGSKGAAGWTKAFSGTNQAAYRNSAVDGTGFYVNVNDNSAGTGGAKEALMTGYEVMTALGTGTGQFPTAALLASGVLTLRKSTTADGTARAWTIVADDTVFYMFTETGDFASPTITFAFMFGDIFSYRANDAYRCMMIGRNAQNNATVQFEPFAALLATHGTMLSSTIIGHYMPRTWSGLGGCITVGKHIDQTRAAPNPGNNSGTGIAGTGCAGASGMTLFGNGLLNTNIGAFYNATTNFPYPNGPDGGLYMCPVWIHHNGVIRGYLKGCWSPLQHLPLNHNDTFSGTGNLSGKSFVVQSVLGANNGNNAQAMVFIETSSTWS
jgi:hypothetical protein